MEKDFTQGSPKRGIEEPGRKRRKIGSQTIAKNVFSFISFFFGSIWNLEPDEIKLVGKKLDDVREEYPWIDQNILMKVAEKASPIFALALVLMVVSLPRLEKMRNDAGEVKQSAKQQWYAQPPTGYSTPNPEYNPASTVSQSDNPTDERRVNSAQLKFKSMWN